MGPAPYVILNDEKEWIGGAEFKIVDIYARKFGFTPNFKKAPSRQYAVQQVHQRPLHCSGQEAWAHGNSLVNYMKVILTEINNFKVICIQI